MRTFADALRGAGVQRAKLAAGEARAVAAQLPEPLARRVVPSRGPCRADNPRARCDFCPRVQTADMLVEVEPDRYACDGCLSRWKVERRP